VDQAEHTRPCQPSRARRPHSGRVARWLRRRRGAVTAARRDAKQFGVCNDNLTGPDLAGAAGRDDGTNLTACQDADCEVEVRVGDVLQVDATFGVDAITVTSVEQDEITLALQGSSGGLEVEGEGISISGNCTNGRCVDEGELSLTISRPGRINEVQISLTGTDSDRAVLVLLPR